jgi:hypothetical protein
MISRTTDAVEFDALRPRLLALVEQHRAAKTEVERLRLIGRLEDVFLATAWHVAQDLLENGWKPGFADAPRQPSTTSLTVIGGIDAA